MPFEPKPMCFLCKHYNVVSIYEVGQPACKAFPSGIPSQIMHHIHDHIEPYPGDNGMLYEPNNYAEASIATKKQEALRYLESLRAGEDNLEQNIPDIEAMNLLLDEIRVWERRFEIARARKNQSGLGNE